MSMTYRYMEPYAFDALNKVSLLHAVVRRASHCAGIAFLTKEFVFLYILMKF